MGFLWCVGGSAPPAGDRKGRPYGSVTRGAVGGPMWASAPTEALQEVQWAGDRKGRPYGGVTRSAVRRADVGIGPYERVCAPGKKTKSPPAFAKDDALHRGTTLLRGLLTQAAL